MTTQPSSDTAGNLEEYFFSAWEAFSAAVRAVGVVRRQLLPTGDPVELDFAGPAMKACVMPAMEHLRADGVETPSMTVGIWDSQDNA